jgi:hypothetical protein
LGQRVAYWLGINIGAAALAKASRVGLYSLKPEKGKVDELKAWLHRTPQGVC